MVHMYSLNWTYSQLLLEQNFELLLSFPNIGTLLKFLMGYRNESHSTYPRHFLSKLHSQLSGSIIQICNFLPILEGTLSPPYFFQYNQQLWQSLHCICDGPHAYHWLEIVTMDRKDKYSWIPSSGLRCCVVQWKLINILSINQGVRSISCQFLTSLILWLWR
jgi:hypothetical protein